MKNMLTILQVLAQIFPLLLAAIKEFEASDSSGADKKAAVLAVIRAILAQLKGLKQEVVDGAMNLLDKIIDAVVAGYNLLGVFGHKSSAA